MMNPPEHDVRTHTAGNLRLLAKNDDHRQIVAELTGYGFLPADIAKHLRISLPLLHKLYQEQIDHDSYSVNIAVLRSLYRMATVGENTPAAIFLAKGRCGYRPGGSAFDKPLGASESSPKKPDAPSEPEDLPEFSVYCNDGEPNYR